VTLILSGHSRHGNELRLVKTRVFVALLVLLASLSSGCEDRGNENGVEPVPRGAYRYTSYDTNAVEIVRGWLTIDAQDSSNVTGEWNLLKIGNPEGIGPQVGSGKLAGSFQNGKLVIELNPQFRDNNLQLVGELKNGEYRGEWFWISFIAVTNRGTFQALQE
jgi:hypothetical protein